jgi:sensor histidine kinase/response regulator
MNGINLYNREEDNFIRIKNLDAMTIDIDQDTKGNLMVFHTRKRIVQISSGKTNMEKLCA